MVNSSKMQCCRICFDEDSGFVSIFQSINGEKITNMLRGLTGELILMDQQVPNYICLSCSNALNIAHMLRQQVVQAETYYKDKVMTNMTKSSNLSVEAHQDFEHIDELRTDSPELQPKVVRLRVRNGYVKVAMDEPPPETNNLPNAEDLINVLTPCDNVEVVFTEREDAYKLRMKRQSRGKILPIQRLVNDVSQKLKQPTKSGTTGPDLDIDREDLERACCMCKTVFTTMDELLEHAMAHPESQNYLEHLRAIGEDLDSPFRKRCDLCYRSFSNTYLYNKHRQKLYLLKTFICENCGEGFTSAKNLRTHTEREHGDSAQLVACSICSKLVNMKRIVAHERDHSLLSDRGRFPCLICNKVFAKKTYLHAHTKVHARVRKYECRLCPKKFNGLQTLNMHMNVHENKRNYACNYCDKTFIHSTDRNRHIKVHTGERPHVCQICQRGFIKKYCLTKHMEKSHPGVKPYKCGNCPEAFMHKSEIEQHLLLAHFGR